MQRGKVLNFAKYQIFEFLKANAYSLIGVLFIALGICLGLSLFDNFKIITYLIEKFFSLYVSFRHESKFFKIVLYSFLKSLLLFFLMFVSGTTLFGVVTVPLTLSFCGFFYGSAVAYLYSSFAIKGVAFNAVIFLPSSLVLIIFFIFAARYSMIFSLNIARLTLPNGMQCDLFLQFKDYSLKFLFLTLGSISAALVDGLTAVSMLRFFEF